MKNETTKVIPEQIHVLGIRILESHFETTEEYRTKPLPPPRTNVQIGQIPAFDMEKNLYFVKLDLILTGLDEEDRPLGLSARYTINFAYKVDNLNELVKVEEKNTIIDNLLAATIISMSYSTARGIILERTQGTFFNGAILPVINVGDFLINTANPSEIPQPQSQPQPQPPKE